MFLTLHKLSTLSKGGSKGGGQGGHAPQDAEVAFWSSAIILIQW